MVVQDGARTRPSGSGSGRRKSRRRVAMAGGGLVIGAATLVTISDDAQHAVTAVKRSARVVRTLFVNIKE